MSSRKVILKNYGDCERCHQPVIGYKTKSSHRQKILHKTCPLASEPAECAICMNEISDPVTTPCKHAFHKECLSNWQDSGHVNAHTCPCCRAQLVEPKTNEELIELSVSILMSLPGMSEAILYDLGVQPDLSRVLPFLTGALLFPPQALHAAP